MKRLFAILIMLSLSLPVLATDETESVKPVEAGTAEALELIQPEEAPELHQDVVEQEPPLAETLPAPYKTPYSKKKLAKKFLIAMLCVAGCSAFLYVTLSVYNKLRDGIISQAPIPPEGEKPLDAPNDLTEAVKTFIEKTKWNT